MKVLLAMQKNRVSEKEASALLPVTATTITAVILWKRFMRIHSTQKHVWCVHQIACGTHALAIALFGNLRPGDEMLAPAGKPYDTLEEVIGIRPSKGPWQNTE